MAVMIALLPAAAAGDQASQPSSPAAAQISAGRLHSCAVNAGAVRCWGYGADGELGYGNRNSIGDDETPGSAGPIDFGPGRTVKAISAGDFHTCALLDDSTVRCWGYGGEGRLGYGNTNNIGDDETPGSAGPVNVGPGRTVKAITAGGAHACALLDNDTVRCWGFGFDGRLGYGNQNNIGDNETPDTAGPVNVGAGRTVKALTAGLAQTCGLLDDNTVKCWGYGGNGRLGYGNVLDVGRTPERTPDKVGTVDLGSGRTAVAISAGGGHACAILDDSSVRCWGSAAGGRLGYGNGDSIGDNEAPGSVGPVDLGGRTAKAIKTGGEHSCAILDDNSVRCWGAGAFGQLGYGNGNALGDDETPGTVAPVDVGAGRTAIAITAGFFHTCARLDDDSVRCWGYGANGRLGYCSRASVGDDEPASAEGPVDFGTTGAGCGAAPPAPTATPAATATATATPIAPGGGDYDDIADPLALEKERARAYRRCLLAARQRNERRAQRRARKACRKRYGRTPGRIKQLHARAVSDRTVVLTFRAPGSDGGNAPAARSYVVKQSRRPIRRRRDFRRAHELCRGACRFSVTAVGAKITLVVTHLRPHSRYHYAVAARDNVSHRRGPWSRTVKIRTKRRRR